MVEKIFIDCGFHHGEGLQSFIQKLGINEDWIVYAFEPNPECDLFSRFIKLQRKYKFDGQAMNAAVWTETGNKMFIQEQHTVTASNSPTDGNSQFDGWCSCLQEVRELPLAGKVVPVPTIDFGFFVHELLTRGHERFVPNDVGNTKQDIIKQFESLNIPILPWD